MLLGESKSNLSFEVLTMSSVFCSRLPTLLFPCEFWQITSSESNCSISRCCFPWLFAYPFWRLLFRQQWWLDGSNKQQNNFFFPLFQAVTFKTHQQLQNSNSLAAPKLYLIKQFFCCDDQFFCLVVDQTLQKYTA